MKIDFTNKEYETLLKMLCTAKLVIDGQIDDDEGEGEDFNNLEQKILSYAKDSGNIELVAMDMDTGLYIYDEDLENECHDNIIAPFVEEIFYGQLVEKLAFRDLSEKYTPADMETMDMEEGVEAIKEYLEKYLTEIEENDIGNIRIVKPA